MNWSFNYFFLVYLKGSKIYRGKTLDRKLAIWYDHHRFDSIKLLHTKWLYNQLQLMLMLYVFLYLKTLFPRGRNVFGFFLRRRMFIQEIFFMEKNFLFSNKIHYLYLQIRTIQILNHPVTFNSTNSQNNHTLHQKLMSQKLNLRRLHIKQNTKKQLM